MKNYIALLRGINVSGQKLIKMDDLKKSFVKIGLENVKTYLQSGNVVFSTDKYDPNQVAEEISRQLEKDYGFRISVLVLTYETLKNVIEDNPYLNDAGKDKNFLHVTFLVNKPEKLDESFFQEKKQAGEEIFFGDQVAYLYCPNGFGKTKLSNSFMESKLKVSVTTRNWRTCNELILLAK